MINDGWILIVCILIVAYNIHELNKHNQKVEQDFADPNPNLPDDKHHRLRERMKVSLVESVILLFLLVFFTVKFLITNWR